MQSCSAYVFAKGAMSAPGEFVWIFAETDENSSFGTVMGNLGYGKAALLPILQSNFVITKPSTMCIPYALWLQLYSARAEDGPQEMERIKQQPRLLPGPAVPGCSLVSFHFLWAILCPQAVQRETASSSFEVCNLHSHSWETLQICKGGGE